MGYEATYGSYFAVIPGGCSTNSLQRTFSGSEIGSITGEAAWFTSEDGFFDLASVVENWNDFGTVKIITDGTVLFEASIALYGFSASPWTGFSYTFEECTTYTLEVSSTNSGDCFVDSYILLDFEVDASNNKIVCDSGTNGDPHCK
jgi:hypothetical protein